MIDFIAVANAVAVRVVVRRGGPGLQLFDIAEPVTVIIYVGIIDIVDSLEDIRQAIVVAIEVCGQ